MLTSGKTFMSFCMFLSVLFLIGCSGGKKGDDPLVVIQGYPPKKPSNLIAAAITSSRIDLTWKDNALYEDGFYVQRCEDGVTFLTIAEAKSDTTFFSDTDLVGNTLYHYRVIAYNTHGLSPCSNVAFAQTLLTSWAKSYGGDNAEVGCSMKETQDGGFIVAGDTQSFGAGGPDAWLLKLDPNGVVEWEKAYGGGSLECARSVVQTLDGGYIMVGYTSSFGNKMNDLWVVKLDSTGLVQWQKSYGGAWVDVGVSVVQGVDSSYLVTGASGSFNGNGIENFWALKLDPKGSVVWQKEYGGGGVEEAYCLCPTPDNGWVVGGVSTSYSTHEDAWLLKLDSKGTVLWQNRYSGSGGTLILSVCSTMDGGYAAAGSTADLGQGILCWLLKLDAFGAISWQKAYGELGGTPTHGEGRAVLETEEGDLIIAGRTYGSATSHASWAMKVNQDGSWIWGKGYNGALLFDGFFNLAITKGQGYAVAGQTESTGYLDMDAWVLKLTPDGVVDFNPASGATTWDLAWNIYPTQLQTWTTTEQGLDTWAIVADTSAVVTVTQCTVEQQAP